MNNAQNDAQQKQPDRKRQIILIILTVWLICVVCYAGKNIVSRVHDNKQEQLISAAKSIDYSEFISMSDKKKIKSAVLKGGVVYITAKNKKDYKVQAMESSDMIASRLSKAKAEFRYEPTIDKKSLVAPVLEIGVTIFFIFMVFSASRGSLFGSDVQIAETDDIDISFSDVAGEEEAKESLKEIVDFLHNSKRYTEIGAKIPKGVLLEGPPGTGKTLLAKAVAGEADVPFFFLSGAEIGGILVGRGASQIKDLFKKAHKKAPCIIFIDEIDAIGYKRGTGGISDDSDHNQTMGQILTEMDGFGTEDGIIILGATNRPNVLDPALLRPGRFDRHVLVDLPDEKAREEILALHGKDVKVASDISYSAIARMTSGASGADLANIINEAAISSVKKNQEYVTQTSLEEAVEKILAGEKKKNNILTEKEREIVAVHEIGHALTSYLIKDVEPVQKITIVPRTNGALGYVMQSPEKEKNLQTEDEMRGELTVLLGGRAAEKVIFGTCTNGASNDLEKATKLATMMVTQYGMTDAIGFESIASVQNRFMDDDAVINCSEETRAKVDAEVRRLLNEAYKTSTNLLTDHKDILKSLAGYLKEKETISGKEFMEMCRNQLNPTKI